MTVLDQTQKLLAEGKVSPDQMDQVSEMVTELADLKASLVKAELSFNSATSATQRLGRLSCWKDLDQRQTDVAIDLAELLNLPD